MDGAEFRERVGLPIYYEYEIGGKKIETDKLENMEAFKNIIS